MIKLNFLLTFVWQSNLKYNFIKILSWTFHPEDHWILIMPLKVLSYTQILQAKLQMQWNRMKQIKTLK